MAEALLNYRGGGRFQAFSGGSDPKGKVHHLALEMLSRHHIPFEHLESKSWTVFAADGTPAFDFVFTLCDRAAREPCPIWPGHPMTAHWGIEDPAATIGSDEDKRHAFHHAFRELDARILLFISLRLDALDSLALKRQLDEIGSATVPRT